MSWEDALLHHVERSIERDFGLSDLEQDCDGDYGVLGGGAPVWVRPMLDHDPPLARVWTTAAHGVKASAAVLREINDLNAGLRQVRIVLADGVVHLAAEVEAASLEGGQIWRLADHVGTTALHVGELISVVHGGDPRTSLVSDDADDADR